jgi:uncharacterized protein (TIGR03435 family)
MGTHARETENRARERSLAKSATTVIALVLLGLIAGPPRSQARTESADRPAFDVVSIKPDKSGDQGTSLRRQAGGFYRATNASPRALIASAYLNEFPPKGRLIFGGPGWIDAERFDIEARAEGNPSNEQERLMLQSLLEDRFKLVLHHEARRLPIYALVVLKAGKTGPQLIPHSGDANCTAPVAGKPLRQPGPGEAMPEPAVSGSLRSTKSNHTTHAL